MNTSYHIPVDRAGRLVLPKEVRTRLGIGEGSELELREEGSHLILTPIEVEAKVVKKKNIWVVSPEEAISVADVDAVLKSQRGERHK